MPRHTRVFISLAATLGGIACGDEPQAAGGVGLVGPRAESEVVAASVPGPPTLLLDGLNSIEVGMVRPSATTANAAAATACTLGDVEALLEAPFVAFDWYLAGESHPRGDLVESCQYRFFLPTYPDGSPITFGEGEPFLGGVVFWVPFDSDRPYASAQELEKTEVRNWLTEVTDAGQGSPIEQTVRTSGLKQAVRREEVVTVRQWGVITALPAGQYISTTVASYAGVQFGFWTVNIFIE